jgi:hypothetical protein
MTGIFPSLTGLGILEVISDERDVQIEMPLDLELQRGHGVVSMLACLPPGENALPRRPNGGCLNGYGL